MATALETWALADLTAAIGDRSSTVAINVLVSTNWPAFTRICRFCPPVGKPRLTQVPGMTSPEADTVLFDTAGDVLCGVGVGVLARFNTEQLETRENIRTVINDKAINLMRIGMSSHSKGYKACRIIPYFFIPVMYINGYQDDV